MAISKKPPRRKPATKQLVNEREVASIINKGGSVAKSTPTKVEVVKPEKMKVQLRLEPSLVEKVDEARSSRLVPPSRHTWFLEAIAEKLARELEE